MKTLIIKLDDELAKELERFPNMSETTRQALRFYIEHISTDTLAGMRASYTMIVKLLKEVDAKIDYIAELVE